jgi:uncharacterized protein (DUF2147 family)
MRGMKFIASTFAVFSLVPAAFESASAASDPTGIWINDTGRGAIEIKPCGNALCGNVVWVKDASDAKGCGKQIIGNAAPAGNGRWDNGWIYSPERGRKYNVELTPLANGKLQVTGYAGLRFLSKTMIWTRAPADLQLCGQTGAKTEQQAAIQPDTNAQAKSNAIVPSAASTSPAAKPAPAKPTNEASKAQSSPAPSEDVAKAPATPPPAPQDAAKDPAPNDRTASANDGAGSDLEKKLDDLGLGKVFTKTKSGKCKLDLPWVKVTIDCEQ